MFVISNPAHERSEKLRNAIEKLKELGVEEFTVCWYDTSFNDGELIEPLFRVSAIFDGEEKKVFGFDLETAVCNLATYRKKRWHCCATRGSKDWQMDFD